MENVEIESNQNLASQPDSPFLMISGHDYRSKRKANVHFIARELSKMGKTRFFSIGYSPISLVKCEPRSSLWPFSNQIQTYEGVECYLWRTLWHPINLHRKWLYKFEKATFRRYVKNIPNVLRNWIADTNTIILESGMSVLFYNAIREINPSAHIIYLCSDALETIGCSAYLSSELKRISPLLEGIRLPSIKLVSEFPQGSHLYLIPHGLDEHLKTVVTASPFKERTTNFVSVGSMLFDPTFFEIAASLFPDICFYIIGGGRKAQNLNAPNIVVMDEMPFEETIAYLQHANVGVAAYEGEKVSSYLVDTSMKLMQFEAYGIPAVCPITAAGERPYRFGYEPGNAESITKAINDALKCGKFKSPNTLSWKDVTERILHPTLFADTNISKKI